VRPAGLLTCLALWAWAAGPAGAEPLPPDPVEAFRRALLEDRAIGREAETLKAREEKLTAGASAIKTLGDLGRALLLQEWRIESRTDPESILEAKIRDELAKRFQTRAGELMRVAEPARRAAAAGVIGETAAAARTLGGTVGSLRDTAALTPDLIRLSEDRSVGVRAAAARALGKIEGDPTKVAPALKKLLTDPSRQARVAAATALGEAIQIAAQQERSSRVLRSGQAVRADLLSTAAQVVPAAAVGLSPDQPRDVRLASITACQQVATALLDMFPSVADTLTRPLTGRVGPGVESRGLSAQELQPIANAVRQHLPILTQASLDPDPDIRLRARRMIEGFAAVRQQSQGPSEPPPRAPVAVPAAFGPAQLEGPSTPVAAASRAAQATDAAPRLAQAPAPGAGPADPLQAALQLIVPALIKGLSDPVPRARLAAVEALETLQAGAAPAIPALTRALADPDLFVRWAATRTLGKLAPREADTVVPALIPLLRDTDLDLRVATTTALSNYGPAAAAAVPQLARTVSAGDPEIRFGAMRAIEHIGTAAETDLLAVATLLVHPNPQVRAGAARLLGRFGPPAAFAIPQLKRTLNDTDADVRRATSEAILNITSGQKAGKE
jgi:HEAT repeat protein